MKDSAPWFGVFCGFAVGYVICGLSGGQGPFGRDRSVGEESLDGGVRAGGGGGVPIDEGMAVPGGKQVLIEQWAAECLMAVPELRGIADPEEFEEAAWAWLGMNEERIAREIAARSGRPLLAWWHDADFSDNIPFGATVMVLGEHRAELCVNCYRKARTR